jgi:hypothetical protein
MQFEGRKPSKYQIDIGNGRTMNIKTLLALLSSWNITAKGVRLSKDRVTRIIETSRTSKAQSAGNATMAGGLVEDNGNHIVSGGSFIAIAFEDGPPACGKFRFWLGMIQRVIHRPRGDKASICYGPISLEDSRIKEMWYNVVWLTPADGDGDHRAALAYKWLLPATDCDEVWAGHTISIPDVTFCPDTEQYVLSAEDLRRLNDYIDAITSIEVAPPKNKRKKVPAGPPETISTSTDMHAGKIVTLVAEPGKRVRKVVDFATK